MLTLIFVLILFYFFPMVFVVPIALIIFVNAVSIIPADFWGFVGMCIGFCMGVGIFFVIFMTIAKIIIKIVNLVKYIIN